MQRKLTLIVALLSMFALSLILVGCSNSASSNEPAAPAQTETQAEEPAPSVTGGWTLYEITGSADAAASPDDVAALGEMGMSVSMYLNEDGTGYMDMFGEAMDLTWETSGNGFSISIAGDAAPATLSEDGNKLSVDAGDGSALVFERSADVPSTPPASTADSSSDSAAAAPAAASTAVDPEEYKASCAEIAYDELARNPGSYEGQDIQIYGQVIQVTEDGDELTLRVATLDDGYGYYDDVVLVGYIYSEGESRILEDDMVRVYGSYYGTYTYESTMGGNITVPAISARYIDQA